MTDMRRSWLVQRLEKARGFDNPFSFGGGLANGGLTGDAMELLRGVWSFDYMGAAEFEFGAVPEALSNIAKAKDLVAFSFDIERASVPADWQDKGPAPEGSATIYVLCRDEWRDEVEARVRMWATERNDLKEPTRLSSTIRPCTEWDGETVGWLELNNGFLFFTDEEMWDASCNLFGVAREAHAS